MANQALDADPIIPSTCPSCGNTHGVVRAAETVAGSPRQIRVRLSCPACSKNWSETIEHRERGQRPRNDLPRSKPTFG